MVRRYFLISLLAFAAASTTLANPSNKWRLQFSGNAESDGTIVIRISPVGGDPIIVNADIRKGTSENRVAKAVVDALREQLPEAAFHVERDDGEDVLIKRRRGAAKFDVEVIGNDVKDVRINRDRE